MPLTALIVDDEPLAREGLRMLLVQDSDFSAIHEARNGREAVDAIVRLRPDLVLLDVQMPEMDGFEVVRELGAENVSALIFVTAHDRFAIQAFEVNALDYLLKPVTANRFAQAVARAKARLLSGAPADEQRQLTELLKTIAMPRRFISRLAVRSGGKTLFVEVEDIDWIEAAQNYVELHCGKARHLLHVTMNAIEASLDPDLFMRIHRSLIVNIRRIKELEPGLRSGEYLVTLHGGIRLQSGRTYLQNLKRIAYNPF